MPLRRFDSRRLTAVPPMPDGLRQCPDSDALVMACRHGAAPLSVPWALLETPDADVARRVCLALDGSWELVDASSCGRLAIRAGALLADLASWRPPRPGAYWDAGWAADPSVLSGFVPRRATLVVVQQPLDQRDRAALADLAARARGTPGFRHALRCLVVGPGDMGRATA
jgi:hypothetical protein